ncbi:rhophilin-1 isoform X6 [Manis pentadactyla]|uniref:rhophilin-1 isoform X6 n=1 Tax=Manis pentadactyla TaxID=143292 RepID=UPI00255C6D45|nr:rhophilin-1 isoform X6 [Manis pentadactyla]
MIPDERPDGPGAGEESVRLQAASSVRKGCDPLAQTQRSRLQSRRARIHQQINKELRMRTGAENLYRASPQPDLPQSHQQRPGQRDSGLGAELCQLQPAAAEGGAAGAQQQRGRGPTQEELISGHFGEDSTSYEAEIRELEDLRQIGARQDRSCPEGTSRAVKAFQRAAGAFSLLRENFSHAPSLDMKPASLSMLEQLMTAQAQECVFENLSLPAPVAPDDFPAQLRLAQEAAQVAAEYQLVHQTMAQLPVRDYVPFPWTSLVRVKAEYFRALAHYHTAVALCDGPSAAEVEFPGLQQGFHGLPTASEPQDPTLPHRREEHRKLGKAHLKRAILGQEEALRLHAVCRALRRVDLLQSALTQALRRSLAKYSELDLEDDFFEATEAPDIQPKTHQRPEVRAPTFSRVKVADIFHRLGPLSVFSAKNRWQLVGPIHVTRGEDGFGFTLRGDSPVLIAAVIPGGRAAAAGLQEGDYIVSVNGQPCKWWKHAEVVAQLKGVGNEGVTLQVVTLLPSAQPPCTGDRQPALGGLVRSPKAYGWETATPAPAGPRPLLGWGRKAIPRPTPLRCMPHPPPGAEWQ